MRRVLLSVLAALGLFLVSDFAAAQATRTWVSGVGDDANPCSRTAPCKTFAGAISKTATGGEINVLDPGGFGGVTITKSITISSESFEAGVLVSGTNAIIINATATSDVVLRGLDIEGLGTGLVGIKVLGALRSLHVEKCTINAFRGTNGSGIEIANTAAGSVKVYISDTIVRNNGQGTGGGIKVNPGTGANVKILLDGVRILSNTFGFQTAGAGFVNASVFDSAASGQSAAGFQASTSGHLLQIDRSAVHGNITGIQCGAGTQVRLGNNSIAGNTTTISGACNSYQNNDIDVGVALTPIGPQ